jgi:hypothetical protein
MTRCPGEDQRCPSEALCAGFQLLCSLALTVIVAACFTSAVLAQVGGPAPSPPQAPTEKVAPKPAGAQDRSKAAAPVPAKAAVDMKNGIAKEPMKHVAVQPNRAPLVQQFTNQARPLLRAELIFARNVCHLNRDELRKINQDAQKTLDEVVTKLVDAQFQPRQRLQVQGRAVSNVDAQQLLQEGMVAVMKQDLTAEQWSLYETERQKRDENRKRMTIRYLVDAIDRELYLSPVQCDTLETSLKTNYDSTWALYLENHLYGNRYYPMTIDTFVTPVLTEAQKKVWQGVQKVGVYWGFAGMLGGFANDPDGLEIELGEPARKAQDRHQKVGARMEAMPFEGQVIELPKGGVVVQRAGPEIKIRSTRKAMPAKAASRPAAQPVEKKIEKTKD